MKYLFILVITLLVSCGNTSNKRIDNRRDAETFNYDSYQNKEILYITYCNNCGQSGDDLIIKFTDNTELRIYAYKYNMKIYQ